MKLASPHYEHSTLFESDLDKHEAERDLYRNLLRAETAIKEGARRRMHLTVVTGRTTPEQAIDQAILDEHEQAMAGFGGPRIPRRSLPTKPRLSPWRRLVLVLTRLRASVRRI